MVVVAASNAATAVAISPKRKPIEKGFPLCISLPSDPYFMRFLTVGKMASAQI